MQHRGDDMHIGPDGLPMQHWRVNPDRGVPENDDQLPIISRVGRGPAGADAFAELREGADDETYLVTGTTSSRDGKRTENVSQNLNAGHLVMMTNFRPDDSPQCFTMTFVYKRPGHEDQEWSFTTPAIPYIGDTESQQSGAGVGTVWATWPGYIEIPEEMLVYPAGTTRSDYGAPEAGEAWTSNLEFSVNGNTRVPNANELAKIIGVSVDDVEGVIDGTAGALKGSDNIIDYIDDKIATIDTAATGDLTEFLNALNNLKADILSQVAGLIYGATYDTYSKKIVLPTFTDSDGNTKSTKIPVGDLNIYSNNGWHDVYANSIRSRDADSENDLSAR